MRLYSDAKQQGWTISEWRDQSRLFGDYSNEAQRIAQFIEDNRRSSKKLREFFGDIYSEVEKLGDPNQESLFGTENVSRGEILDRAVNTYNAEHDTGVKYSLERVNGKNVAWIENSELTGKQLSSPSAVARYISEHIGEVYEIIENGRKVYIGEDLPNEYTHSKYSQAMQKRRPKVSRDKNRAANALGELIEVSTNERSEPTKHPQNKDAKFGMYRYDTSFAFPTKRVL